MAEERPRRLRAQLRKGVWSLAVFAASLFGPALSVAAPSVTHDTSGESMAATPEAKFMVVLFARDGSASKGAEPALDVVLRIDATEFQRIVFYRPVDEQSPTIDAAIEFYGPAEVLSAVLGELEEELRSTYEARPSTTVRNSRNAAEIDGIGKVMFERSGDFERRKREWPLEVVRSVRDAQNFMQLTTSVNETMTETVLRSHQSNPPRCERSN